MTFETIPVSMRRHRIWPWQKQGRLRPISGLRARHKEDQIIWEACDNDPQFLFDDTSGVFPLSGGWYRLRMRVQMHSGMWQAPCLYPMYNGSYSERATITLHMSNDWIDQVILLPTDVQQLRFDPSTTPATFNIKNVTLHRLGKAAALWHILAALRPRTHSRWWTLTKKMLALLRQGPRQTASFLYAKYINTRTHQILGRDYSQWLNLYDVDSTTHQVDANSMGKTPLISILLPVHNIPAQWLRRCIDSVLAQQWPHWELCIVDDASTQPAVRELLADYARHDPRIHVHYRTENGHISTATNDALKMAGGEFIVLLDHDDKLRPHSLLEVAKVLQQQPDLDFIYSDEDKIDEKGQRSNPYFKPDWNPDLLLSQNYICHMVAIRRDLVVRVGGMRVGYEGSQDHDLFLRCTSAIDPARIYHIPKILYHWRAIEGSTALQNTAKNYAADAGARALSDHISATCPTAKVSRLPYGGYYRVKWPLPEPAPKVSLIIPTRDRVQLLRTCVESILKKTNYPDYEILIVDNQSQQTETLTYFETLQQHSNIRIIPFDAPFNYSAINNHAIQHTDADVIGLINNDIEAIHADWLDELVSHAIRPGIGAVGAMLYYPDNTIQHAGIILGIGGVAGHIYHACARGTMGMAARARVVQNLSAVTAACLVVKRERYLQCGGLDEKNLTVAFNDVDFCLRLREAGYRNLWTPFAELYHHESASRGMEDTPKKQARFRAECEYMRRRWGELLDNDPAYNPNLTLVVGKDSSLAFPPRKRT